MKCVCAACSMHFRMKGRILSDNKKLTAAVTGRRWLLLGFFSSSLVCCLARVWCLCTLDSNGRDDICNLWACRRLNSCAMCIDIFHVHWIFRRAAFHQVVSQSKIKTTDAQAKASNTLQNKNKIRQSCIFFCVCLGTIRCYSSSSSSYFFLWKRFCSAKKWFRCVLMSKPTSELNFFWFIFFSCRRIIMRKWKRLKIEEALFRFMHPLLSICFFFVFFHALFWITYKAQRRHTHINSIRCKFE